MARWRPAAPLAFCYPVVLIKTAPYMKLWLLCFVILFAAAEGLQSFSGGFNLFPAIAWHPLTVLAGIGLAVLSNAKTLGLGSSSPAVQPSPPSSTSPKPSSLGSPSVPASPQAPVAQRDHPPKANPTPAKAKPSLFPKAKAKPAAKAQTPADSISFDLRKSS